MTNNSVCNRTKTRKPLNFSRGFVVARLRFNKLQLTGGEGIGYALLRRSFLASWC